MTCREARDLIHGMIDSALTESERASLEEHLSDCPPCRRYADLFRALKDRLAAIGAQSVAGAGRSRLRAFLESPAASDTPATSYPRLGRRPGFVWAAAAAVLVAFGVFFTMAIFAPSQTLAQSTIEQHRLRTAGQLVLDSHADCCKDLQDWFETQVNHPVDVPEIKADGLDVEGGKLYRHDAGNEMFYVAFSIEGRPVSLFICCGPNMEIGEGKPCSCSKPGAVISAGPDYTMVSWPRGETTLVLVSPFDSEETQRICEAIE